MIKFIGYLTSVGQYKSFSELSVGDTFWINGLTAIILNILKNNSGIKIEYKMYRSYQKGIIYFYNNNCFETDFPLELAEDSSGGLIINRNGTIWVSTTRPNPENIVSLAKVAYSKVIKLLKGSPFRYPVLTKEAIFNRTGVLVFDTSFELENLE